MTTREYILLTDSMFLPLLLLVLTAAVHGEECLCRTMGWYSRCELESTGRIPACVSNETESLLLDAKTAPVLDGRSFALTPRLSNLKVLNLPYGNLSEDLFGDLRDLLYLDLSSNRLLHLGSAAFERVQCNALSLDGNDLRSVADGAFQNVTSLSLRDNDLASLSASVFLPHSQVRVLDLAHNKLRALPSGLLDRVSTLEELHVQGNPWRCDCRLLREVLILRTVLEASSSTAECFDPPDLRGVALLDLPRRLQCGSSTPGRRPSSKLQQRLSI